MTTVSVDGGRAPRVEGIDLLRGLAIALVMLRHALPHQFPGAGVVGVVMFFALSGYLITGVLHGELRRSGRVDLRRFYLNRAARLVPALLVMVLGLVAVTLAVDPLGDRGELGRTVLVALTYTGDLPFSHGSAATFHLWTLAMEEQFYLLWPAALVVAWNRRRLRALLALSSLVCIAACAATLIWLHPFPDLAYQLPTSWAGCFVIGAAARLHVERLRSAPARPSRPRRAARMQVPVALAVLGILSALPLRGHTWTYLVVAPAVAFLTAAVLVSWRDWHVVQARVLRPLVWLGTVSYGAYLWNYPLILWLGPSLGGASGAVGTALTLVAAALSWRFVEHPVQRMRRSPREPTRRDLDRLDSLGAGHAGDH